MATVETRSEPTTRHKNIDRQTDRRTDRQMDTIASLWSEGLIALPTNNIVFEANASVCLLKRKLLFCFGGGASGPFAHAFLPRRPWFCSPFWPGILPLSKIPGG